MRKKIVLSLIVMFAFFAFGAFVSALNIRTTTAHFNKLIKLHQVENLRHDLIERTLTVLADLYTYRTPLEHELDVIVGNVAELGSIANQCTVCHHSPQISADLDQIQVLIHDFQDALSFYITASAKTEKINSLRQDASFLGNKLLYNAEHMSFTASKNIDKITSSALAKIEKSKTVLTVTLVLSFIFGGLIAVSLVKSITRPTHDLVHATRRIAAGELGYTIPHAYKAEFGEIADNFNTMSLSLKEGLDALQESQERYALAAHGANDGLWDWNLTTDTVYYSPRWKAMLGYADQDIGNNPESWYQVVHPDDLPLVESRITDHLAGKTSHLEVEHRMLHSDGKYRWMLNRGIAERDSSGRPGRMAGSQTDVTVRKLAEERLAHDAFHDSLTGLPNRALFKNLLQHAFSAGQRRKDALYAVLFIDLDRFKMVNDSLGHLIGDQLLIAVGHRLSELIRPSDTIARFGGDEFAILLEDMTGVDDATQIAQRIQQELPIPFMIDGHEVFSTASIGISLSSTGHDRPENLLRDADLAMYQAKINGKARFEIFDEKMHASTMEHLRLETDLRRALERNEFLLHYQPILSLETHRITGFEALIRWQHPSRKFIPPADFIPIAEETGLITDIGRWVLREASLKLSQWQQQFPSEPPLTMSVNLSAQEFTPGLINQVNHIQQEIALEPFSLKLEITERMLMDNPHSVSSLLFELRKMGIGLHIDDFGTGYSSLSYLHDFPIDVLKIDQSFIKKMNLDRKNLEIVKTIISLARNLNMEIIAEGVETEDELQQLKLLKCGNVQGFLVSKPVAADVIDNNFVARLNNRFAKKHTG